jgi:hypothetical protein
MATTSHYDAKATTERLSDDVKTAPTTLEAGSTDGHRRLVAPPLVAAMSAEERVEAEKRMRRKIDTRLLPMIILMYIMSKSQWKGHEGWDVKLTMRRLP